MRIHVYMGLIILLSTSLVGQNCDDTAGTGVDGPVKLTVEKYTTLTTRSDKLVLVNFTADWCIVCKKQQPILNEIKLEKKNVCELLTVDMECNPLIAEHFEVDALPVILLYKNGKLTFSQKGLVTKPYLISVLQLYE